MSEDDSKNQDQDVVEDATMELSLADVFSIKKEDKRALAESSHPEDHAGTLDISALRARAKAESSPYADESDTKTQTMDDLPSIMELDEDDLSLLDEDTNPSIAPPSDPPFIEVQPLEPDEDDATRDDIDYDSSTSVLQPTAELLEAARRGWENSWETPTEGQPSSADATGHFEIPAALLQEAARTDDKPASRKTAPLSKVEQDYFQQMAAMDKAIVEEYTSELSKPVEPVLSIEAFATVDEEGRLVIAEEMLRLGPLEPGMRVRLLIDVLK